LASHAATPATNQQTPVHVIQLHRHGSQTPQPYRRYRP